MLTALHASQPNTADMDPIYDSVCTAIDNQRRMDPVKIIAIDAMGGSGKTTFAKKIFYRAHSHNKIVLGYAATGLACQVYEELDFETVHSGFGVPVVENEEDYDNLHNIECMYNPQRAEVINAADVLIFDEVFSNHKYNLTAIMKTYNGLRGKVVLFLMDRGQTTPIVKHGGRRDCVNATIMKLPLWDTIERHTLSTNLRLLAMENANPIDPHFLRQKKYAKAQSEIRTNGPFDPAGPVYELASDNALGEKLLCYKGTT
jgi:nucleoside-triphosphatase THEP1